MQPRNHFICSLSITICCIVYCAPILIWNMRNCYWDGNVKLQMQNRFLLRRASERPSLCHRRLETLNVSANRFKNWLTDWLRDWVMDWLINWLIEWWIDKIKLYNVQILIADDMTSACHWRFMLNYIIDKTITCLLHWVTHISWTLRSKREQPRSNQLSSVLARLQNDRERGDKKFRMTNNL